MIEKRFDIFVVIATITFTFLTVLHNYNSDRLIFLNSYVPFLIYFIGSLFGLVIIYLVRVVVFRINESVLKFASDFVVMAKSLFLAVLIFGSSLSWLFDYFNMKSITDADIIYQKCKVYKVNLASASGTHNSIDFDFYGRNKSISNFTATEIMNGVYKKKKYDSCYLYLSVKKGLLTSYIIEDYSFIIE